MNPTRHMIGALALLLALVLLALVWPSVVTAQTGGKQCARSVSGFHVPKGPNRGARLDSDGDPNTRDASDLVGRGVATWDAREGTRGGAVVQLESRGAFGRLVTQRAAPPPRAS